MASPHSDKLDRSVCHPDKKVDKTNSSDGDFLDRPVHFPTIEKHKNKSCYRTENRNKSPEDQTINKNEKANYSTYSGNQDDKKEHIKQKGHTTSEHRSDVFSPKACSARTSSHVNPLLGSPDPERDETNREICIPNQFVESPSNIIVSVDNYDIWTNEQLQQKDQNSFENGSDFLPLTSSSDLNQATSSEVYPLTAIPDIHPSSVIPDLQTTATISAPPASSDRNPPTASPDKHPSSVSPDLKTTASISAPSASSDENTPTAIPDIHPSSVIPDLQTTATISATPNSTDENPTTASPDIHQSSVSPYLKTTATISAPPASSDGNPPTASPDIHPPSVSPVVNPPITSDDDYTFSTDSRKNKNNSWSFIPRKYKENTSFKIGIAATCLIGIYFIQKITLKKI